MLLIFLCKIHEKLTHKTLAIYNSLLMVKMYRILNKILPKKHESFLYRITSKFLKKKNNNNLHKDSFRHHQKTLCIKCDNSILFITDCICFEYFIFNHFPNQFILSLIKPSIVMLIILHRIFILFFKHQNNSK